MKTQVVTVGRRHQRREAELRRELRRKIKITLREGSPVKVIIVKRVDGNSGKIISAEKSTPKEISYRGYIITNYSSLHETGPVMVRRVGPGSYCLGDIKTMEFIEPIKPGKS